MKAGQRVGPYTVLRWLGEGSMGAVYAVRRPDQQEIYALKTFNPGLLTDPSARARLSVEMRAQAQVDHPHVVRIVDLASDGDVPFLVMELVEGETLQEALTRGLALDRGLELLAQVADGLEHVHQHGILHRDVKPANILIDDGRARLSDFGISRIVNTPERLTQTGEILGTPGYMAPELIDPSFGPQSPATDVYSVGAVLYELLCGQRPFRGASLIETFDRIMTGKLVPPRRHTETPIPPELEAVCLKALARDPAQRFQSAGALRDALRQVDLSSKRSRAGRFAAAGVLACLAIVAIVAIVAWGRTRPSASDPSPPEPTLAATSVPTPTPEPAAPSTPIPAWIAAARRGEFRTAARLATTEPPRTRARLLAWAGEPTEAQTELNKSSARWRPALGWELLPVLGESPPSFEEIDDHHVVLASGESALGSGDPPLARLRFRSLMSERHPLELRVSAALGHARACLAEGDLRGAAASAGQALALTAREHPWLRTRSLDVAALVLRADPTLQADWAGFPAQEAPGLVNRPVRTIAEIARQVAPKGFRAVAPHLAGWRRRNLIADQEDLAFCVAEAALQRSGADGPAGTLVAHAATLAGCAERGNDLRSAQNAERLLFIARRLRPASPTLEIALSQVFRVQRNAAKAVQHAQRARRLAPQDPVVLLELGRALTARAEGSPEDDAEADTLFRATALLLESGPAARARHLKVAKRFAEAAVQFRDALRLAKQRQSGPMAVETSLSLAQALKSQLIALAFGGKSDATLRPELRRTLQPIVSRLNVRRAAKARTRLLLALSTGDRRSVRAAEDDILQLLPSTAGYVALIRALRLIAQSGGEDAPSYQRAYLLLNGDLPARGLAWFRVSEASQGNYEVAQRAHELSRRVVAPAHLGMRILHKNGIFQRLGFLGELVINSPELIPFLLRFYEREPARIAKWDRTWRPPPRATPSARHLTHFARAMILRGWRVTEPTVLDAISRRGAMLCLRFLKRTPLEGPAHMLRALHLASAGVTTSAPPGRDVSWAIAHHLACAEAERPWSFVATQAGLWVGGLDQLDRRLRIYLGVGGNLRVATRAPFFVPESRRALLRAGLAPLQAVRRHPVDWAKLTKTPLDNAELYRLGVFEQTRMRIRDENVPWRDWLATLAPHNAPARSFRLALERRSPTTSAPAQLALEAHWASAAGGRLDELPSALTNWEVASSRLGPLVPLADAHLRERWFGLHFSGEGRAELIGTIPGRNRAGVQPDWPKSILDPWGPENLTLYTLQLPDYQEQVAHQGLRTNLVFESVSALQRAVFGRVDPLLSLLRVGRRLLQTDLRRHSSRKQRLASYRALYSASTQVLDVVSEPRRPIVVAFQADALLMMASVSEATTRTRLLERSKALSDQVPVQRFEQYETHASVLWRRVRPRALLGNEDDTAQALTAFQQQVSDVRRVRAILATDPLLGLLQQNSAKLRAFVQAVKRKQ